MQALIANHRKETYYSCFASNVDKFEISVQTFSPFQTDEEHVSPKIGCALRWLSFIEKKYLISVFSE